MVAVWSCGGLVGVECIPIRSFVIIGLIIAWGMFVVWLFVNRKRLKGF